MNWIKGYDVVSVYEVLIRITAGWQIKGEECVYTLAFNTSSRFTPQSDC